MAPFHDETFGTVGGGASNLLKELIANNNFFDEVVDMLPAKLYVSGNTGDEAYNPKYHKGQHKESKEARRARNKVSKIQKYDPNRAETTLETKRRKAEEDAEMSEDEENDNVRQENNDEAAQEGIDNNNDDDDDDDDDRPPKNNKDDEELYATLDFTGMSRVEILQTKLRAKIAAKRALRPAADANTVSKRAARRAEKQKRIEAAKARKAKGGGHTSVRGSTTDVGKVGSATTTPTKRRNDNNTTVSEDLEGVDFGGIAGLTKKAYHEDNRSLANARGKKKSLDRLLKEAEDKRKRLEELKAGSETDRSKAKKLAWGDALKEADGARVRDDPAAIKKAMRVKAKKKAKSAKAWKDRNRREQNNQKERQNIRSNNLDRRKMGGSTGANLSKKRIVEDPADKNKKRRRMGPHADKSRAGFEGKKNGFITKEGSKAGSSK